jgi:hypothetical protein
MIIATLVPPLALGREKPHRLTREGDVVRSFRSRPLESQQDIHPYRALCILLHGQVSVDAPFGLSLSSLSRAIWRLPQPTVRAEHNGVNESRGNREPNCPR